MYRLFIAIKKEALLMINDKVGLALMFAMPVLLVFIITIIQDSAFKIVESNSISLLVVNQDEGKIGKRLIEQLKESGMFDITENNTFTEQETESAVDSKQALAAVVIDSSFSKELNAKSEFITNMVMADLGMSAGSASKAPDLPRIAFFHDAVLQENYCSSIINVVYAHLNLIENAMIIENLYQSVGQDSIPSSLQQTFLNSRIAIDRKVANGASADTIPSSTQHNVPAWTIFAMFFMVVSLGTNIVKERISGSFVRLKTVKSSFLIVLLSKEVVYVLVGVLQVALIFSLGKYIFPKIGLPELIFPDNYLAVAVIILLCALTAVSYAMMIGSFARTEEQANGIGAISIIIFAALGGVWVPSFVMPDYMQVISAFSPLHWCIEGFYVLFLKQGEWSDLVPVILFLGIFSIACQLAAFLKLKFEKLL